MQDTVVKRRVEKDYRIKELDSILRKGRQRREIKVIEKLKQAGVPVPDVIASDEQKMELTLSFIKGPKVRDAIDGAPEKFGAALGMLLAKMHMNGISHGDPTTSNFIWNDKEAKVYVIDFGLSFFTAKTEDFAVDMHLLKQVLTGTHTLVWEAAWKAAVQEYQKEWPDSKTIDWLEKKVEKRGRNKKR
jgi:TP53 regulating kinase-like protein